MMIRKTATACWGPGLGSSTSISPSESQGEGRSSSINSKSSTVRHGNLSSRSTTTTTKAPPGSRRRSRSWFGRQQRQRGGDDRDQIQNKSAGSGGSGSNTPFYQQHQQQQEPSDGGDDRRAVDWWRQQQHQLHQQHQQTSEENKGGKTPGSWPSPHDIDMYRETGQLLVNPRPIYPRPSAGRSSRSRSLDTKQQRQRQRQRQRQPNLYRNDNNHNMNNVSTITASTEASSTVLSTSHDDDDNNSNADGDADRTFQRFEPEVEYHQQQQRQNGSTAGRRGDRNYRDSRDRSVDALAFVKSYDDRIAAIIAKVESMEEEEEIFQQQQLQQGRGRGRTPSTSVLTDDKITSTDPSSSVATDVRDNTTTATAATITTRAAGASSTNSNKKKKFTLTQFMDRQAIKVQQRKEKKEKSKIKSDRNNYADGGGTSMYDESTQVSHLSDVPSDCDSVTKERYLLACQMLKTTMIQKETSLIPIEKEYLLSLLGDFDYSKKDQGEKSLPHGTYKNDDDDGDDNNSNTFNRHSDGTNEETASQIEHAVLRLKVDPVFQRPALASNAPIQRQRQRPPVNLSSKLSPSTSLKPNSIKKRIITEPSGISAAKASQQQTVLACSKTAKDMPRVSPTMPQRLTTSRSSHSDPSSAISDKNPHTATRRPQQRLLMALAGNNPCGPRGAVQNIRDDSKTVSQNNVVILRDGRLDIDASVNDEAATSSSFAPATGSTGGIWRVKNSDKSVRPPTMLGRGTDGVENDDDGEDDNNDYDKDQILVRFNGWSFHQSTEKLPFFILGATDEGGTLDPRVLTPQMMEALRSFMPYSVTEANFWLKYSLVRDGASLQTLLGNVRDSTYTVIAVETTHGEVFGSFTGCPWRIGSKWFGNGEAFLWRLKKCRYTSPQNARRPAFEREMEVFPYTGYDDMVQYCTTKTIAVGGGDWLPSDAPNPFDAPSGIGFMIDGDLAGGETNSCSTFANPRLAKHLTTASSEFTLRNLEVWTMTSCATVSDAIRLEKRRGLIEDQHSQPMSQSRSTSWRR